jgi:hypothetical protein
MLRVIEIKSDLVPSAEESYLVRNLSSEKDTLVYKTPQGWYSDDQGFLTHRVEEASRSIRVVKEFIKLGKPLAARFFVEKSKIEVIL